MKAYSFIATALAAALAAGALRAQACTRVLYQGPAETVLTGRTMDWKEDPESRLWLFPRGMHRSGAAGENSLEWVSKYGSVITSAYDICTTDGMNEKGLAANLLWLAESVFPIPDANRKALSVSIWAQYVLDCFATVAEVVERFSTGDLDVVSDWMPDGSRPATLHLSISDATGDSAIFEYIGGKLAIHHDRAYTVMTNSPVFEQQLALDDYWNGIGGLVFLPGTNRAADRFVRASFYIGAVPRTDDIRYAAAALTGIIRNVSVPLGIRTPNEPNISSTRWRTMADQKNRIYYYESTLDPALIRIDFGELDFSDGAPVRCLDPKKSRPVLANSAAEFVPAAPFRFQAVTGGRS
ncbi:linear amide C-N hydrolase [uncultured Alistipes sp.]|uniref:linear amide C-N hydrolase n=1 Tax=uncultured Alistipes sp. TaxID=538949 RepID=UPI0025E8B342|nr:linear amide C-N hydrolase [uncultured Alistipes sp.]